MAEPENSIATAAMKKKMPKGGRKGGATFPRISLENALKYAEKLVSKTHTGGQPEATILAGVFGSSSLTGEGPVRASALRQYGLLEGDKTAYRATELAKQIGVAPEGEKPELLKKAFLSPRVFFELYQTFHGDTISAARIRQRAQALNVHPDSLTDCAGIFMESAVTSCIGKMDGENIALLNSGTPLNSQEATTTKELDENESGLKPEATALRDVAASATAAEPSQRSAVESAFPNGNKGAVTVNLTVDSSSDPEKLEKQLRLLKQFGLV